MGNHCIDCKFCGQDQRLHGDSCCAANIAHMEAETKAREEIEIQEDQILTRHGLSVPYYTRRTLPVRDVVAFLKRLEEGKVHV